MDSKKTQKVVVVILLATAFLGIIGALLVYYLSTQDSIRDDDYRERKTYCACVVAYTTPECNDCSCTQIESQALKSRVGEVVDGTCTLDCDVTPQTEEENETIECLISQVRGNNCHSISVKNINSRELIIPPISIESPILITADFVPRDIAGSLEQFTRFVFVINGVTTEIDASEVQPRTLNDVNVYSPELEFSDFEDIDTLTIQAVGYSDKDPDGGSPGKYCYRQYDLTQARGALCSNLIANVRQGSTSNITLIDRLELNTPNLTRDDRLSIEFTFDYEDLPPIRTTEIPQNLLEEILVNEKIFLERSHLYSTPEIYLDSDGFPTLDRMEISQERISILATLIVNDRAIDSGLCRDNIVLLGSHEDYEPDPSDPDETDPDERDEEDDDTETEIRVAMEGPNCVRKAEEGDISRANYRITVTNNSENTEEITKITNKLPLGFKYLEETTTINGNSVSDRILDTTSIGESQELVWSNDWEIEPDSSLVLEYAVNVTNSARDGENQNEAVVSPVNIPEDMSLLRAEFVTLVSDDCEEDGELPDTGNLTLVSFFVGIGALIFGMLVYQGRISFLDRVIFKLISTETIKKRIMSPQEYLEDSILEEEDKEKEEE